MVRYDLDVLLLALFFSIVSGIGVYLQGVRENRIQRSFTDFFGEIFTAFIGGALAYYLAQSKELEESLMIFCVIASSNNGRDIIVSAKDKVLTIWTTLLEFMKYKSGGNK